VALSFLDSGSTIAQVSFVGPAKTWSLNYQYVVDGVSYQGDVSTVFWLQDRPRVGDEIAIRFNHQYPNISLPVDSLVFELVPSGIVLSLAVVTAVFLLRKRRSRNSEG